MLLPPHQNSGQNQNIKIGNRSFKNVTQFKCLGTTVTNQSLIQEEIKKILNSGNACYHSVQNLLSSCLLSKNLKITYTKVYFACGSEGVKPGLLTLREEHRLRVFENRVHQRGMK
jgi:hypothetical protein